MSLNRKTSKYLLALVLTVFVGCSASSPNSGPTEPTCPAEPPGPTEYNGSVTLTVSASQGMSFYFGTISVTVSADDIPSYRMDVPVLAPPWSGTLHQLPTGRNLSILVQAFDEADFLVGQDTAHGINLSAGEPPTAVSITLQAPPGDPNDTPLIDSLVASSLLAPVGSSLYVTVAAHDPNPADTLSYSWSASCPGSWEHACSSTARFTPTAVPETGCDNCSLTVFISDGHGGLNSSSLDLCVSPASPGPHSPPLIVSAEPSSDSATPGQQLSFLVEASDPQDSGLRFSWTANTGTLGPAQSTASTSRVTWTAPSTVLQGLVPTVTVTVTNAFRLSATQSFTVSGLPSAVPGWATTGAMAQTRERRKAVLLANGKVLVAGAFDGINGYSTAEVYDPVTGTWSATGSMSAKRGFHTLTLLPNGKVLAAGGIGYSSTSRSSATATAELYDPATGTWSATGSMGMPRMSHTATLLPNGKVLVVGGAPLDNGRSRAKAEVYDPATGTWSATGAMSRPRMSHTATLLNNGKVLVVGTNGTAEVYNPATGTWSATGSANQGGGFAHALLLPNGKVLVVGAHAEVYAPATGTWSMTGPMVWPFERWNSAATRLSNGKVLAVGTGAPGLLATAQVYDPATGAWSPAGTMSEVRWYPEATLLPSGQVLVTGLGASVDYVSAAELYSP